MTEPLVSCVMPTRDRRPFANQAIWYFLRQRYPNKELIVVDDGDDPIRDLVAADDRIRYVRLDRRATLGAKRDLGCKLARGELVAHWDDDDWIGPSRLSAQVSELASNKVDVCGARGLLCYRLAVGDAWFYRPGSPSRPSLAGGTLLYRRSLWQGGRFPDVNLGETTAFLHGVPSERMSGLFDPSYYVAVIHRDNATATNVDDSRWEPRPFDEVSRRLSLDRQFYADLRNGAPTRSLRRTGASSLTLATHFMVWDGYGSMAEYLALGLANAGADVRLVPLSLDPKGVSGVLTDMIGRHRVERHAPVLWFAPPPGSHEHFPETSDVFVNTMWESDRLPKPWLEPLSRARAVVVPTRFVARICRREGLELPVEVVPEGIDPDVYTYVDRPERPGLTTLIVGPVIRRKHTAEGIAAWQKAFEGDSSARLLIKSKFGIRGDVPHDPRIVVVDETEPCRGILHWYAAADVVLALGSEGFGLPLVEGMASGLPVIALSSEGQADVCRDAAGLVLPVPPVRREVCDDTAWGKVGLRGVPSVDDVAARLRWVEEHREEAQAMGRAASDWARRHRNVWDKGPAVLELMERRLKRRRPLRRVRTLWMPPGGEAITAYVEALARALCVPVQRHHPRIARARLVHVQHLFGDDEDELALATVLLEARLSAIPTVVTAHGALQRVGAWERDATAIVTLTDDGGELLRRRWPGKRIETIPAGCETWFPRRKRRRGAAVAVLPTSARGTRAAVERIPRVRVVDVRGSRGSEERALQLAAEADAAVLWPGRSADPCEVAAEARASLASGVPLLVKPTESVAELADVTYQQADLGEGLPKLLADRSLADGVAERARRYCADRSWALVAQRHLELWAELEAT